MTLARPMLLLLLLASGLQGCRAPTPQSALVKDAVEFDGQMRRTRLNLYEYAFEFVSRIEGAADEIILVTDDAQVHRNAILWEMHASVAMQRAAFQSDTVASLADVWALTLQQQQFLEGGAGKELFGDQQSVAAKTASQLATKFREVAQVSSTKGNVEGIEEKIVRWAKAHPIEDVRFQRESLPTTLSDRTSDDKSRGLLQTVAGIEQSVADLEQQMTFYAAVLPSQARWQVQLGTVDAMQSSMVTQPLDDVHALRLQLEAVGELVLDTPELIARERALVTQLVRLEREALMQAVTEERTATMAQVSAEREAIFADLRAMEERVLAAISVERGAALTNVEEITHGALDRAMPAAQESFKQVVDHAFLRLLEFLAAIAAAGGGYMLWLRRGGS